MQNKVPFIGVKNAVSPSEGPKVIPLLLPFSQAAAQLVDLVNDSNLGIISIIQGVFIDNSNSNSKVTLLVQGTQQVICCPAGWQGFFPLFTPMPPKFTATCAGGVDLWIMLYNMPMPAAVWPGGTFGSPQYDANSKMIVTDPILDGIVADPGSGSALATYLPNTSAPGDGKTLASFLSMVSSLNTQFNGTTTELTRGNIEGSAIASGNRADGTVTNSSDITNYNGKGLVITSRITVTAGGTVTVKVQARDPISTTQYVDIPGAVTAALAGVGNYIIQIAPALTPVANSLVSGIIPRTFRIVATVGGGANVTYQVGYSLGAN